MKFLSSEITKLEPVSTKITAAPIPSAFVTVVVIASTEHSPTSWTITGLFLKIPSKNIFFIYSSYFTNPLWTLAAAFNPLRIQFVEIVAPEIPWISVSVEGFSAATSSPEFTLFSLTPSSNASSSAFLPKPGVSWEDKTLKPVVSPLFSIPTINSMLPPYPRLDTTLYTYPVVSPFFEHLKTSLRQSFQSFPIVN